MMFTVKKGNHTTDLEIEDTSQGSAHWTDGPQGRLGRPRSKSLSTLLWAASAPCAREEPLLVKHRPPPPSLSGVLEEHTYQPIISPVCLTVLCWVKLPS